MGPSRWIGPPVVNGWPRSPGLRVECIGARRVQPRATVESRSPQGGPLAPTCARPARPCARPRGPPRPHAGGQRRHEGVARCPQEEEVEVFGLEGQGGSEQQARDPPGRKVLQERQQAGSALGPQACVTAHGEAHDEAHRPSCGADLGWRPLRAPGPCCPCCTDRHVCGLPSAGGRLDDLSARPRGPPGHGHGCASHRPRTRGGHDRRQWSIGGAHFGCAHFGGPAAPAGCAPSQRDDQWPALAADRPCHPAASGRTREQPAWCAGTRGAPRYVGARLPWRRRRPVERHAQ